MRKWIDLLLFYATLVIIVSGIVLYIMPHGRVAYFTGWEFLGIDKDGWDSLHIVFGILMVVVAIWHIVVNWKVMKKYLLQKESFVSILIVLGVSFGSVFNLWPFKGVMDLQEYIKNSWEVNKVSIPFGHAELLSLKEFCKKLNIPLDEAISKLNQHNIRCLKDESLKEISKKNNTTPSNIYNIIKSNTPSVVQSTFEVGSGIGRMSLEEFCKKYNYNINKVLKLLKEKNIKANKTQTLRDIAFSNNITPIDLASLIEANK